MGDVNTPILAAAAARDGVETLLRTLRQLDLNRDDAIFIQRTGLLGFGKPLNCHHPAADAQERIRTGQEEFPLRCIPMVS